MAYSSRMLPFLYDIHGTPENDYHSAHTHIFHRNARPHRLLGYRKKTAGGLKSKPEIAVSNISPSAAAQTSAMLALRSQLGGLLRLHIINRVCVVTEISVRKS